MSIKRINASRPIPFKGGKFYHQTHVNTGNNYRGKIGAKDQARMDEARKAQVPTLDQPPPKKPEA